MDLAQILAKVNTFKESHPGKQFSLKVIQVKDLDDTYGDLYILAYDELSADPVDDDLLISIEKPDKEEVEQLEEIATALEKFL